MSRKVNAVLSAIFTIILFVGIPYFLPNYIPQEFITQIEQSGFDLNDFTYNIIIIGVVTASLTLIGGFVNPASINALIVKILQACLSLLFIIIFLGAGNILNLGYTTFDIAMEGINNTIIMDLSFFVYISIITILLKIIQVYFEWKEARIEMAPPGRIAP